MSAHLYHPQCGCSDCCRAERWIEDDFAAFEDWQQGLPPEQLADLYWDFIESLEAGQVLRRNGSATFEDWAYDNRWQKARGAA